MGLRVSIEAARGGAEPGSRTTELGRSAGLLGAAHVLGGAVALALPLLIVRRFDQTSFGTYKQLDLVATLLLPILGLGLDKSLTYFIPREREHAARYVTAAYVPCALAGLLGLAAVLAWPGAAGHALGAEGGRLFLLAAVSAAVSSVFVLAGMRVFIAVGDTLRASAVTALRGPALVLVVGTVVLVAPSLPALLWAYVALNLAQIVVILALMDRRSLLVGRTDLESFVKQLRYGIPLWGSAILQVWTNRLDRYLVSLSHGAAGYAIYAVGRTSVPFYAALSGALETVMAPKLAEWEGLGEHRRMAELWKATIVRMLPMALIVCAAIEATAGWLVPLLFTENYRSATSILRVSAISLLFVGHTGTDGVLRAFARVRFLFVTNLLNAAVRLALTLAALATGSLALVAAAAVGVETAVRAVQAVAAARCLQLGVADLLPVRRLGEPLALSIAGTAASLAMTRVVEHGIARLLLAGVIWGSICFLEAYRIGLLQGLGLWPPDPRRILALWRRRG